MKRAFNIVKWTVALLIVASVAIWATGNEHLFRGISLTYMKGLTGPTIDDHIYFKNSTIDADSAQPWETHPDFNKISLSDEDIEYHKKLGSVAYLIIKDKKVLHESYWDSYSDTSLTNSFSMAKSIVSVLVGCAIQDGLIESVDSPAVRYLPEYHDVLGDSITIRHLLTMSSGINFDESYGNPFGMMAKAYYGTNIPELVKDYRPTETPGKEFKYLGGNTLLLGFIVEKVTEKKLSTYATVKLWRQLQATQNALWTTDDETESERSYCCFYSNARDFARIGQLYLDKGRWDGKQIVPEDYVTASTTANKDMEGGDIYGYQWWILDYNGEHIFYARGIKGQYIFVRPEKNAVIVRLGHTRESEQINGVPKDVIRWLQMSDNIIK